MHQTQGSFPPCGTTLGFEAEALWDSHFEKVHGFKERKFLSGKSSPRRGKILLRFVEEWKG